MARSKLPVVTYWKKNGEVRESHSALDDQEFKRDGWIKSDRGGFEWYKRDLAKRQQAPADSAPQPAATPAADVGMFDLIERRIVKTGDQRYLEGINEPIGLETAKYINDQSIALRNSQKGVMSFYEMYQEANAELAPLRSRVSALEAALAPFAKEWDTWDWYAREGGDKGIVEILTMGLQPEVLAKWLKDAADAIKQPGSPTAGEGE